MDKKYMYHITRQAVIQRINRELKKDDRMLRKNRRKNTSELGEYFVVDLRHNAIYSRYKDVDVEKLAREIKVLTEYEKMED